MTTLARALATLAALCVAAVAAAQQIEPPDRYDLFSPKPGDRLRPLSANRPDTTESPYTVDAGHLQIEMSFVEWTRDQPRNTSERTTTRSIAPVMFILGVLEHVDLEIGLQPYIRQRTENRSDGSVMVGSGFGDTTVRVKFNLWGNDDGDTAFALLPYVKLPTADDSVGNGRVEGGILLPLAIKLPAEFDLAVMAEFDVLRNPQNSRYVGDFLHSASLSREIVGPLAGFVEYVGQQRLSGAQPYRATLNAGLTYGVSDDLQLDGGVGYGLNDAADDLRLFTGLAIRF